MKARCDALLETPVTVPAGNRSAKTTVSDPQPQHRSSSCCPSRSWARWAERASIACSAAARSPTPSAHSAHEHLRRGPTTARRTTRAPHGAGGASRRSPPRASWRMRRPTARADRRAQHRVGDVKTFGDLDSQRRHAHALPVGGAQMAGSRVAGGPELPRRAGGRARDLRLVRPRRRCAVAGALGGERSGCAMSASSTRFGGSASDRLVSVFALQGVLMRLVSRPVQVGGIPSGPPPGPVAVLGTVCWAAGLACESVGRLPVGAI
jgi:hypothetical protein